MKSSPCSPQQEKTRAATKILQKFSEILANAIRRVKTALFVSDVIVNIEIAERSADKLLKLIRHFQRGRMQDTYT